MSLWSRFFSKAPDWQDYPNTKILQRDYKAACDRIKELEEAKKNLEIACRLKSRTIEAQDTTIACHEATINAFFEKEELKFRFITELADGVEKLNDGVAGINKAMEIIRKDKDAKDAGTAEQGSDGGVR